MTAFQEKWPWNKELLKYFLIIPTAAGVVLTIILYFFIGINSFWFLCSILIGLMLGFMYGYVGKKVEQLKNRFKDDEGEVVESLTVIQKYESPGIVILRKEELVVINILNRRATISLDKLKILKEGQMLPGKYLMFKKGFILDASFKNRLAFAVPKSVGERWSKVFANKQFLTDT